MFKRRQRRAWMKLALTATAGGWLVQTSACNQGLDTMARDLSISVVDTYIVSYFGDKFDVPSFSF